MKCNSGCSEITNTCYKKSDYAIFYEVMTTWHINAKSTLNVITTQQNRSPESDERDNITEFAW